MGGDIMDITSALLICVVFFAIGFFIAVWEYHD